MPNQIVAKSDTVAPSGKTPRFTPIERVVLASGALTLSVWIGGLAWVGFKLVTLII